jgi:predicted cupin superfamily sugar epimerase
MNKSDDWIEQLALIKHPEGGYYKETYRASLTVSGDALPEHFGGERVFSTSIYYLLEAGDRSLFHRIKSDEIWHFYDGFPLVLMVITPEGKLKRETLGLNPEDGLFPQISVPAGHWFAARSLGAYTLVGCTVSPGFDFADFELADRKTLLTLFPHHRKVVEQFT